MRGSILPTIRPTSGEKTMASTPLNAVTRPACVAVYPRSVCSHSGTSTPDAKNAA